MKPRERGSALVEALAALVLVAMAGLVVASAATTALRASRRASVLEHDAGLAARELASVASQPTTAASGDAVLAVPGLDGPVGRHTEVTRSARLVAFAVQVTGGQPAASVAFATKRVVDP